MSYHFHFFIIKALLQHNVTSNETNWVFLNLKIHHVDYEWYIQFFNSFKTKTHYLQGSPSSLETFSQSLSQSDFCQTMVLIKTYGFSLAYSLGWVDLKGGDHSLSTHLECHEARTTSCPCSGLDVAPSSVAKTNVGHSP